MALWINHVAIATPRNGTTTHTVDPTTGTVVAGATFTPTSGRLLLCVAEGAVTSTTPSGWTLPSGGSAINKTGLYVWYKTAAGSDSVTTTHNGSNYPVAFHFFEFASGSTFLSSASSNGVTNGGAGPTASGLTGTHLDMFAFGREATGAGALSVTWSVGTELVDTYTVASGTSGYSYSLAYVEDATGSSASSAATWSGTAATIAERLTFALSVVAPPASNYAFPYRRNASSGLIMRGRR